MQNRLASGLKFGPRGKYALLNFVANGEEGFVYRAYEENGNELGTVWAVKFTHAPVGRSILPSPSWPLEVITARRHKGGAALVLPEVDGPTIVQDADEELSWLLKATRRRHAQANRNRRQWPLKLPWYHDSGLTQLPTTGGWGLFLYEVMSYHPGPRLKQALRRIEDAQALMDLADLMVGSLIPWLCACHAKGYLLADDLHYENLLLEGEGLVLVDSQLISGQGLNKAFAQQVEDALTLTLYVLNWDELGPCYEAIHTGSLEDAALFDLVALDRRARDRGRALPPATRKRIVREVKHAYAKAWPKGLWND